jgi:hypothetical protein
MSHGKREFEGDINTIEERMKARESQEAPAPVGNFDFLKQIETDYGIHSLGNKMYEVEVGGVKHQGSLASIFEALRSKGKTGASE